MKSSCLHEQKSNVLNDTRSDLEWQIWKCFVSIFSTFGVNNNFNFVLCNKITLHQDWKIGSKLNVCQQNKSINSNYKFSTNLKLLFKIFLKSANFVFHPVPGVVFITKNSTFRRSLESLHELLRLLQTHCSLAEKYIIHFWTFKILYVINKKSYLNRIFKCHELRCQWQTSKF